MNASLLRTWLLVAAGAALLFFAYADLRRGLHEVQDSLQRLSNQLSRVERNNAGWGDQKIARWKSEGKKHFGEVCAVKAAAETMPTSPTCALHPLLAAPGAPEIAGLHKDCVTGMEGDERFHLGNFLGLKICVHPPERDGHMSAPMARGDIPGMEAGAWRLAKQYLDTQSEVGLMIDLGANVGLFTWMGLLTKHTVLSVEPLATHCRMIMRGAMMNGVEKRLLLYRNAVSNACFQTNLMVPVGNPGGTQVERGKPGSVDVVTVDDILSALPAHLLQMPLYFVKIDVEGQEPWALKEASLLWQWMPHLIFMEVFHWRVTQEGCSIHHLFAGFLNLGYQINVLPRLNLNWPYQQPINTLDDLTSFTKMLSPTSEMDILLKLRSKFGL